MAFNDRQGSLHSLHLLAADECRLSSATARLAAETLIYKLLTEAQNILMQCVRTSLYVDAARHAEERRLFDYTNDIK